MLLVALQQVDVVPHPANERGAEVFVSVDGRVVPFLAVAVERCTRVGTELAAGCRVAARTAPTTRLSATINTPSAAKIWRTVPYRDLPSIVSPWSTGCCAHISYGTDL